MIFLRNRQQIAALGFIFLLVLVLSGAQCEGFAPLQPDNEEIETANEEGEQANEQEDEQIESEGSPGLQSNVIVLFTSRNAVAPKTFLAQQGGGPVPVEEIASLLLTLERIIFIPADGGDIEEEEGGEEEEVGEGDEDQLEAEEEVEVEIVEVDMEGIQDEVVEANETNGEVVVFDAAAEPDADNEIDLVDLRNVSQIISFREILPGNYEQVRLEVSNPRLRLGADPEDEYRTNVMLTANGRVFITTDLTIPPDEKILVQIDFGGIHLVRKGNGDFVLTPQLRADILLGETDIVFEGAILDADEGAQSLTVEFDDGSLVVDASAADIFLLEDEDIPTGEFSDLPVGAVIRIEGVINVDCLVTADAIRILELPPEPEETIEELGEESEPEAEVDDSPEPIEEVDGEISPEADEPGDGLEPDDSEPESEAIEETDEVAEETLPEVIDEGEQAENSQEEELS